MATVVRLNPGESLTVVSINPDLKPTHPIVLPPEGGTPPPEVWPPLEPPPAPDNTLPATPPAAAGAGGNWVWAWSPQLDRWVWVRIPGAGEAGPKKR